MSDRFGRVVRLTEDGWAHSVPRRGVPAAPPDGVRATVVSPDRIAADTDAVHWACFSRVGSDGGYFKDGARVRPVPRQGMWPGASCVSGIEAPEDDDVAVMVGLGPNGEDTGEIVGIHVYPLLPGAAKHRPEWRRLVEPDPPPEPVARFVAEVRGLLQRYWAPAPPIVEPPRACSEPA